MGTGRASSNLQEIPVEDLKVGMFVAELDRPWLGTPFLLQGFRVQDADDLTKLKNLCKVVYVDQAQGNSWSPSAKPAAPPNKSMITFDQQKKKAPSSARSIITFDRKQNAAPRRPPKERYIDSVDLQSEIRSAQSTHQTAQVVVHEVIDRVRGGGRLDVPALTAAVAPMIDSVMRNKDALSALVRMKAKDSYTYNHCLASSVWTIMLGRQLGLERDVIDDLAMGAVLMDIGKTKLPEHLLTKDSPLTDEEMLQMRRHVEYSLDMISEWPQIGPAAQSMIETHHERFDGTGYSRGLEGNEIPIFGRIAGLADTYDAMISERAYAKANSSYAAMRKLNMLGGTLFQPELVEQLAQAIGMFPTGAVVELSSSEVAIVVGQNATRRLRPQVMIVLDADKKTCPSMIIDLISPDNGDIKITHELEVGAYGISADDFFL